MKLSCNTIQDLLPLVAEDLASEDTVNIINEHLEKCERCRGEYKELKSTEIDFENEKDLEAIPLKKVKRKLKNRNIYIGILTALIVSLFLFIAFDKLTKPIPIVYSKAVESIEEDDGKVFIEFSEDVSNYEINYSEYYGEVHYDIVAWTTYLSSIFDTGEVKNAVINVKEDKVDVVYYLNQDGSLDKLIYGESFEKNTITLPRLTINYYFVIAGIVFIIFMILSLIFRKNHRINKITTPIMILALSYILSHIIILGTNGTTYHMIRDFLFIIITGILLFSIFILLIYKNYFAKIKNYINK
ncbi:zf-HC2 domain-containing protein [Senegalia massiliensis]|uniref:zf-HC2 domain-containing protein n=1 Tax=Senegalia massiliensis TaxID=1720316 RepID=UPI0010314E0D|nr:zf-HC2 domain-containing protein [Senegalia massiliensis]